MRETLEQAILEHPEDPEAFGVYADWLTEQGDPRGAFIHVQLALEDASRPEPERRALREQEAALLAEHSDRWLGPLAPLLRENPLVSAAEKWGEVPNYTFQFRRGFLHTLEMERLYVPMARALRDWPDTRLLQRLAIGAIEDQEHDYPPGDDVPTWEKDQIQFVSVYPLLGADLSGLRWLRIGAETDFDLYLIEEYGPSCHTYCKPLPELIERMPRVEELHLLCKKYDMAALFASRAPSRLRVLHIAHFGVSGSVFQGPDSRPYAYPLEILAENPTFANLTHLLLHPHHEEWHWQNHGEGRKASFLPLSAVRSVLHGPHLRGLTHLQLRLSDMGDAGVREIVDSGALSRLQELDLRHGCITDEGARTLAEHPDTKRLHRLDLSGNALTEEGVALIEGLGSFASAGRQLLEDEIEAQSYLYRGDTE